MGKRIRSSLVFWILLFYAGALFGHLAWQTAFTGKGAREKRGFYLQHALRVSKPLLKERERELVVYLNEAVELGLIDHYELEQLGKKPVAAGFGPLTPPVLTDAISEVDGWIWGRADTAEASLRIGVGVGWKARLARAWTRANDRMPSDFFFLFLACVTAVFLQRRRQLGGTRPSALFREGRRARLIRAAAASAPPPPSELHDFDGVFARTVIFLPGEGEESIARLESFCTDAASLLARYSGRVHSLHGHELLSFFTGEPAPVLARLATAASRDLAALAENRGVTISTCLAFGRFHCAQVLGGAAIFGAAVDETATHRMARKPGVHLSDSFTKAHGPGSIRALDEILADCRQGKESSAVELAYHRSDEALARTLRSLAGEENWNREGFVAVMSEMRRVQCRECSAGLLEAYRALLQKELFKKDSYRLSSTLALAPQILSRAVVDKDLEKKFLEAVVLKDRRVRANAVELFTRFFPEREIPELKPLVRDEDNRVSANALIKAACERFDERVIARMEERVHGGSVAHVASALHAVGEIAAYYRRTDPLFLGTKIGFLRLFDSVPDWAQHPNPMIRRQALIAAHKLGSSALNARLEGLFLSTQDSELLVLFENVYGWKREELSKPLEPKAA